MAGIVFGAVTPHGWLLIPELHPENIDTPQNRAALVEMGARMAELKPDVIVIATPHGFRVDGSVSLANVARAAGTLTVDGHKAEMNVPVDLTLTDAIAAAARARGVPIAMTGFAGNQRNESALPLDWGTFVPLWFMGHGQNHVGHGDVLAPKPAVDHGPPIVLVNPSRFLPRQTLVDFGEAVADAAAADGRRVAFIASCDWAHAHEGSRYGASPDAAIVDQMVVDALNASDPGSLIALEDPRSRTQRSMDFGRR